MDVGGQGAPLPFSLNTLDHSLWQLLGVREGGLSQSVVSKGGTCIARGEKKNKPLS